jgi:hypothetical protein
LVLLLANTIFPFHFNSFQKNFMFFTRHAFVKKPTLNHVFTNVYIYNIEEIKILGNVLISPIMHFVSQTLWLTPPTMAMKDFLEDSSKDINKPLNSLLHVWKPHSQSIMMMNLRKFNSMWLSKPSFFFNYSFDVSLSSFSYWELSVMQCTCYLLDNVWNWIFNYLVLVTNFYVHILFCNVFLHHKLVVY